MKGPLVWLIYARVPGVGRVRLSNLIAACPDPLDAWELGVDDLLQIQGWIPSAAESLVAARFDTDLCRSAQEEWSSSQQAGMRLIALSDPDYPVRLRDTPDPPPYFYQIGPWQPDARPVVAIVGTRKPTGYGLSVARRMARELCEAGAVVVSGMARGIDCAAHQGALEAGGTTVAVLGGGADVIYPAEAAPIYRRIVANGAVLSEQPPGAEPLPHHFPERNRIISGLAHGVLVVEAGENSGTLITAEAAGLQGRDVFAVPGPISSPMSVGPHRLIRDGACLVTTAADILQEMGFSRRTDDGAHPSLAGLEPGEEQILRWMGSGPRWAGDLAEATGIPAGTVQGILTMLEMKGLARQLPGGQYVRVG